MTQDALDNPGPDIAEGIRPEGSSEFIEDISIQFEEFGVPRIGGRIAGLLILANEPVSSEDMASTLKVSRSSISTNLRMLQMSGWVEKVSLPGDRTDYYIFAEDAWEKAIEMRLEAIIPLRELAEEGLTQVGENQKARSRLGEMKDWVDLLEDAYERVLKDLAKKAGPVIVNSGSITGLLSIAFDPLLEF